MSRVAVIGGGLTGMMMAQALSHSGAKITLIDRSGAAGGGSDNRTTTINAAGQRMLSALSVWQKLAEPACPIWRIAVAEGPPLTGLAARRRAASDLNWQSDDTPMAYVVGNSDLQMALGAALADRGVDKIEGCMVTSFGVDGGGAYLHLTQPDDVSKPFEERFDLVVACDGARSQLAEMAGLHRREERQFQTAIVTLLRAERDHENTAYQRFLDSGPFALMPMQDNMLSLVWTLPNARATELMTADQAQFEMACVEAFGQRLGYLHLVSDRLVWPLQPAVRKAISTSGIVLAGDAAHAIHPIAGQGYNLALADAAVLADILAAAHARGLLAGHPSVRQSYEARRRAERLAMSAATSGINHLFAQAPGPIRKLAGVGFTMLDRMNFKDVFADIAEGGRLSDAALLRGELPDGRMAR